MALIKTEKEIERMREGGKRLAHVLYALRDAVKPGITGKELDKMAEKMILAGGDALAFKNYQPRGADFPFPATLCVSVNDVIVHGIPNGEPFKEGDIVGLDLGLAHGGLFVDMAVTVAVGKISDADRELIDTTEKALNVGIAQVRADVRMGEIGSAIEAVARPHGYGIVRELGGHGVGHEVHEEPYIPNFGKPNTGPVLRAGMVLALEPMFNLGTGEISNGKDNFSYRTLDGKKSAHFEKTIVVTKEGSGILTEI
ncbi:MAG: type I methionyl aminopeptidase [Candidatus Vogelbacteria bacterium]|nr:type I methionyl aminopeptidase [Candidatus Vogelbacteria bacterium]